MIVYLILALVFAVFVALFAVQNAGEITIAFLAWQWDTSVAVLILGSAAFGGVFGGLIAAVREVQFKLKLRGVQNEVKRLGARMEDEQAENSRLQALLLQRAAEDRD